MLTRIHLRQKPGEMWEGPDNGFSVSPESEAAAGTPRILSTRQHLYTMLQRQLLLANTCVPPSLPSPLLYLGSPVAALPCVTSKTKHDK